MKLKCTCGLTLQAKYRGKVKEGQTVAITCRCGRRLTGRATKIDEVFAALDGIGRAAGVRTAG